MWCGWAVIGAAQRFWFAGDTGYCGVFKEIGQKYGPFDLSAIPIGAYDPRWLMKPQHIDPAEAVQIHQVLLIHSYSSAQHVIHIRYTADEWASVCTTGSAPAFRFAALESH